MFIETILPPIYVLHHANCFDGTGAKYAAWTKFKEGAHYIPVQYGEPLPSIPNGAEVYVLDFSYDRATLEALHARSKSLLVLDHHKTAAEDLNGLPYAKFDMAKSGAVLAWEHFQPGSEYVPSLLLYIQDRDLWKWEFQETKPIMSALPLLKADMEKWDKCVPDKLRKQGEIIEAYNRLEIEAQIKKTTVIDFEGYRCGFFNTTTLASEKGNYVCENMDVDFSLSYYVDNKGIAKLSFRSLGDFDVSGFAKKFNGGGHRNASGGWTTLDKIQTFYSQEIKQ